MSLDRPLQDFFTLHIRGVGQWTNRLYTYFEEEYRRLQEGKVEERSGIERLRGYVVLSSIFKY